MYEVRRGRGTECLGRTPTREEVWIVPDRRVVKCTVTKVPNDHEVNTSYSSAVAADCPHRSPSRSSAADSFPNILSFHILFPSSNVIRNRSTDIAAYFMRRRAHVIYRDVELCAGPLIALPPPNVNTACCITRSAAFKK